MKYSYEYKRMCVELYRQGKWAETPEGIQKENGYITMDADRLITLTDSGMDIVSKMLDRHHTLTKFLVTLGIDEITAEKDACKIEHDISQETYEAICAHAREMSRD
jgi:Mn-dependent DtxR family transcriptional regulator